MTQNTLFPGRPDYTGPTCGIFGFLHHKILCESSHDVMERIRYVESDKPDREIAVRLHNMIYLGGCEAAAKRAPLDADYEVKHARPYTDYRAKRVALDADYEAKCAPLDADILTYIKTHIPDCAWDGRELV